MRTRHFTTCREGGERIDFSSQVLFSVIPVEIMSEDLQSVADGDHRPASLLVADSPLSRPVLLSRRFANRTVEVMAISALQKSGDLVSFFSARTLVLVLTERSRSTLHIFEHILAAILPLALHPRSSHFDVAISVHLFLSVCQPPIDIHGTSNAVLPGKRCRVREMSACRLLRTDTIG